jgi:hypothetical protein
MFIVIPPLIFLIHFEITATVDARDFGEPKWINKIYFSDFSPELTPYNSNSMSQK